MKKEVKTLIKGMESVSMGRFFKGINRKEYTQRTFYGNKKTLGTYDNWTIKEYDANHIEIVEELAKDLGRQTITYYMKGYKENDKNGRTAEKNNLLIS